jgi:hypothetical protein
VPENVQNEQNEQNVQYVQYVQYVQKRTLFLGLQKAACDATPPRFIQMADDAMQGVSYPRPHPHPHPHPHPLRINIISSPAPIFLGNSTNILQQIALASFWRSQFTHHELALKIDQKVHSSVHDEAASGTPQQLWH